MSFLNRRRLMPFEDHTSREIHRCLKGRFARHFSRTLNAFLRRSRYYLTDLKRVEVIGAGHRLCYIHLTEHATQRDAFGYVALKD